MEVILKGGHVIDPSQKLNATRDVRVLDGKIVEIAREIKPSDSAITKNVTGNYVVPGLIDMHTHIYWGATSLSVNANDIYKRSGITTFVDAGSSGAGNFLGFYEYIVKPAPVNIYAFLNIAFPGIFAFSKQVMFAEASLLPLMSIEEAVEVCRAYSDCIVGIKARSCQRAAAANGLAAIDLSVAAADACGLPVMTHVGYPPPSLEDVVRKLRKGDIMTHAFREPPNSFVLHDEQINTALYEAKKKGILLDIGHGMAGFGFRVARRLAQEGIWPDTISSDIHVLSVNGPAYDVLTTMSKFLNLGMPLDKIIAAVTSTPAAAIKKSNIGSLKIGSPADITVLKIEEGDFVFLDGAQQTLKGDRRFFIGDLYKDGISIL